MLAVWKQSAKFQRVGLRCIGSIVNDKKIPDFPVKNEPVLTYLKGSKEREELEAEIKKIQNGDVEDIPIMVGGKELRSDEVRYQVCPHDHKKKIAKFHYATTEQVEQAAKLATKFHAEWNKVPIADRIEIWLRAADLMATKYRARLNATTMLGQSKTMIQAEIDSACELADFFRFNAYYLKEALKQQPISENPKVTKNSVRVRGYEGFMAAVAPFNFTAIGGNLAYTPALVGNCVLWKPSDTALLSNWTIYKICLEAGVPPAAVSFVPADGPTFGNAITKSPHFAGLNFTGSVPTFQYLLKLTGQNVSNYRNFPRMIGECGGKNYHFVHSSADVESVVNGTIRSAFEYCGQKCSACSRMYVPQKLWPKIKEGLVNEVNKLKIGDPTEADTFAGAVIDDKAFKRITGHIERAKSDSKLKIIAGGDFDNSKGYFVQPTVIETSDPQDTIMKEEIFGPVLTVYTYNEGKTEEVLDMVDNTTNFALTGAVFAQDKKFLEHAFEKLKNSAGNFYVNDKSTGSVVGQQPFGGARWSGTNDKAGGPFYAMRFANIQAVKETFEPLRDITYPYMKK